MKHFFNYLPSYLPSYLPNYLPNICVAMCLSLALLSSLTLTLTFASPAQAAAQGQYIQPDNLFPKVKMETSLGDLVLELDRTRARLTVNNFLGYVAEGQYDNTVFHRVETDFIVQGGGYNKQYEELPIKKPIFNESGNGLKNDEGSIAMARLTGPHSATRQFFFNLKDNKSLNPGRRWGYAVFGTIVEGFEVLEAMNAVEIDFNEKLGWPTVPKKMLILKRVSILKPESSGEKIN